MSDFMDEINKQVEAYGGGSNHSEFFTFGKEKKVYQIRVLNEPTVLATHFFGPGVPSAVCVGIDEGCPHHAEENKKPSIKLVTYVVDREDGEVKLAELPLSLSYAVNDLQEDVDFQFDEFPMPYDVKITHDPQNDDPKAKYRLSPSPKMTEVTSEERQELNKKMEAMTPEQYVEKRKDKQKEKGSVKVEHYPTEDIKPEDIPF